MKPQHFAGPSDAQNKRFAFARGHGDLDAAFAEHHHASSRFAFGKENGPAGVAGAEFDGIKRLQRTLGKVAKESIAPQSAALTAFTSRYTCRVHSGSPFVSALG